MQISHNRELRGTHRANQLGLTSQRFHEDRMSEHAREQIESVKLKDRSYLKVQNILSAQLVEIKTLL